MCRRRHRSIKMTDYAAGKIYALRCHDNPELCYVGSTVRTLARRMDGHRCYVNRGRIFGELGPAMVKFGPERFYIELLEDYPCGSRKELELKEGEWARQIGTLNRRTPGQTSAEWTAANHEEELRKHREYNAANRAKIGRLIECGCGVSYSASNQWNHAKSARHQAWVATQLPPPPKPPKINSKEAFTCECGGRYTHYNRGVHQRTALHREYLERRARRLLIADGAEASP